VKWRSRKGAALAVLAVVLSGIAWDRHVASLQHDEQVRREVYKKAQSLKGEIDGLFPVGSARAAFMAFAGKQAGWQSSGGDDWWISVGQEPSPVWYCGPWEVGVRTRFREDRVTSTSVGSWGLNCP
jgi:hypothetical protein